jgi:alpha-beta hydrolase superfamily lysophospholipase
MIAVRDMLSTMLLKRAAPTSRGIRATCLLLALTLLSGCAEPPPSHPGPPPVTSGEFTMTDGTSIPYRAWLPDGVPSAIVLAVHGMNDSRDAWEYPAPAFTSAGIGLYAPDLRGFGATPTRGLWPGTRTLVDDVCAETRILRHRYPRTRLIVMAESMGAAVAMVMATEPEPPSVDGYVLIAPAVWGRAEMNLPMRALLWLADEIAPGARLTGGGFVKVTASDNRDALIRLSNDPLTIRATRVDAVKGLVDLMDTALAAAPRMPAPSLFLYGGHDELIPPRATAATWRALPPDIDRAFYPDGYHLMLRDKDRARRIDDILAWIRDPEAPLPSGADVAARAWLEKHDDKAP